VLLRFLICKKHCDKEIVGTWNEDVVDVVAEAKEEDYPIESVVVECIGPY